MAKFTVSTLFRALDGFTGPVTQMSKTAGKFSRSASASLAGVGRSAGNLRRLLVGVGAALTTGLVAKGITDFASRGDEIAKTARMLGLSAEALQELRFAADREGVSMEDLNTGFRLMNKNLGDLQVGQGTLYSQLKLTNPALARQLKTTHSSEEAFNLLIDAIGKETNTAKRAALAQAAFGRSGQELIKMAIKGTAGLKALREEARRLGIIDQKTAEASERFQDALTNLKVVGQDLINRVLGPMIEKLNPLIEGIVKWVAANKELIIQRIDTIIGKIGKAFKVVFNILSWIDEKDLWAVATAGVIGLTAAWTGLNAVMMANPIGAVIASLEAMVVVTILIIRYWDEITAALRSAWNWFNKLFQNPWIHAALSMICPLLEGMVILVRTLVDLLSGRGLSALQDFLGPLRGLTDLLGITKRNTAAGAWNAPTSGDYSDVGSRRAASPGAAQAAAMGAVAGTVERHFNESRGVVDVNFNNTPAGTQIRQRGVVPGFNLNVGPAFANQ